MNVFNPKGPLLSFTSASSAPTSVQAVTVDNERAQQIMITNVDTTNDAVVGWGETDAKAKINAAAPASTSKCVYVLHGSQVIVSASAGAYFSGIAVASTAVIKVQAGTAQPL